MLQQLEQEYVPVTLSWVVSHGEVAAESRAEALWLMRLRWERHADASTAEKSFNRKLRKGQPTFNSLWDSTPCHRA